MNNSEFGFSGMASETMDAKSVLRAQMMAKSVGLAAVLALIFGGLGLLYVSISVGLICVVVEIILFALSVVTMGIGGLLFIPWHIFCVILAVVLTNRHNNKLISGL